MFLGINSCFLHIFQLDRQGHFIPILLSQDANVVRFYPPPDKMASNSCNNGHGMCHGNMLPKVKTGKKTSVPCKKMVGDVLGFGVKTSQSTFHSSFLVLGWPNDTGFF